MNVIQQFERVAGQYPEDVALILESGSMKYCELLARAAHAAQVLRVNGVKDGDLVAVLTDDPVESIVALLGAMGAGAVYMPLDAALPAARLTEALAALTPRLLWLSAARVPGLMQLAGIASDRIIPISHARHDAADRYVFQTRAVDALAYIFHSSGSTGAPKRIGGSLEGVGHFIAWEIGQFGVARGTRVSQLAPPFVDSCLRDIFVALCAGGAICIPPREEIADGRKLEEWLARQGVELAHMVPSLFRQLLATQSTDTMPLALRHVLLAGERVLPSDAARWFARHGDRTQLVNLYGPTETVMTKLFHCIRPGDGQRSSIPVGTPLPDVTITLIGEDGATIGPEAGEPGEIVIETPFDLMGYYRQPELTRQVFSNTANGGLRRYRTGDYGRWMDGGTLEFLGRRDQQVKIRGFRVELGEIESALTAYAQVKDAAVLAVEHAGATTATAFVAAHEGSLPNEHELRAYLRARLPVPMLPERITVLRDIPRLANGKVDRRTLLNTLETVEADATDEFIAQGLDQSFDPHDQQTQEIFRRVLRREDIGSRDNFFDVGGDSLGAVTLALELEQHFQRTVTLNNVLAYPTPLAMGEFLRADLEKTTGPVVALNRRSGRAPLWLVHPPGGDVGYYCRLAMHLGSDQPAYGLRYPALCGDGDRETLESLADYFVQHIRSVQARGPYALGGISMGGIFAFAVAQRLAAQGEAIRFVALFDSDLPYGPPGDGRCQDDQRVVECRVLDSLVQFVAEGLGVDSSAPSHDSRQPALTALRILARHFTGAKISNSDIEELAPDSIVLASQILEQLLGRRADKLLLVPGLLRLIEALSDRPQFAWFLRLFKWFGALPRELQVHEYMTFARIFRSNVAAATAYRPSVASFKLVLVQARHEPPRTSMGGWSGYSDLPLDVIHAMGNHFSSLAGVHARRLAQDISRRLE